jgi:hypothetical protein
VCSGSSELDNVQNVIFIAGHLWTNPWQELPDWPCYRNADAGLSVVNQQKTDDAIPYFVSAFQHPCMSVVQIHAAWPNPFCVSMSMLYVHAHTACPCPCQCSMSMSMSMYIYIEMLECWNVWHQVSPVLECKKLTMLEQVWYQTKLTQSGIFLVRYWTKIRDARMPMPALISSMPMPC